MIAGLILAVTLGCGVFSGGTNNLVIAPTEVGTPVGDKAAKEIGPAGGSLTSADGRLTLTVPQNALSETVTFTIQAVTGKAKNGVGNAYRFEPDGKKFSTPLELSFRYNDQDLEGTVPEALSIAYQDEKGAWRAQNSGTFDATAKTLTVPVTHFTDYTTFARLRLIPPRATVRVRQSQIVQLLVCAEPGLIDRLLSRPVSCDEQPPSGSASWSLEGPGNIQTSDYMQRQGMMFATYIAPARRPNPSVAKVKISARFYAWNPNTGESTIIEKTFESRITIVGPSYRATGTWGGMTFSGTVCSLDKPFKIIGQSQLTFNFSFTPSSETGEGGTVSLGGGGMGVTLHNGSGSYTVTGIDTDNPRIALTMDSFKGSYPGVGTAEGSGTRYVDLVPLDTNECEGQ